ncbi:alpha/beta hydrolase fold domain-containing protein [Nocardia sp. NPDC050193]
MRVYPPDVTAEPTPALLWIHGGGFVGGNLDMPESHAVCRALARHGIQCVSVDYRLVPVFTPPWAGRAAVRFPLPLDDCEQGWRYLIGKAHRFGAGRLYVGGASAGGALAASLALRLRDSETPPAGVALAYPLLHSDLPPMSTELQQILRGWRRLRTFSSRSVRWMTRNYVGRDQLDLLPLALPGGSDLTGFPPALIINSERDSLRASGEAFADELKTYGRPVDIGYEPGTAHGHLNRPDTPAFERTITTIAQWVHSK